MFKKTTDKSVLFLSINKLALKKNNRFEQLNYSGRYIAQTMENLDMLQTHLGDIKVMLKRKKRKKNYPVTGNGVESPPVVLLHNRSKPAV